MPLSNTETTMKFGPQARFACVFLLSCCLLLVFPASVEGAAVAEDHMWSRFAKRQQAFDDCVGYMPLPAPEPAPPKKSSAPAKKRASAPRKKQTAASGNRQGAQNRQESTPVLIPVMINPICPDDTASGVQGQGIQTNMTPRVVQEPVLPPAKANVPTKQPATTALPQIIRK